MSADEHRFEHRRRKHIAVVLRQHSAQTGDIARGEIGERLSEDLDRARVRGAQPGQRMQQCRLACPIAAENRPAFPGPDDEIEATAHAMAGDRHRKAVRREKRARGVKWPFGAHRCSRRNR